MSDSNEVVTDPRLEKRTRRRFSVAERKRLLAEADALPYGEKGAWLRRKGQYAGQLSTCRKELAEHGEVSLTARKPGRKAADPRDKEIDRLKKANARLEKRAYVAEQGALVARASGGQRYRRRDHSGDPDCQTAPRAYSGPS